MSGKAAIVIRFALAVAVAICWSFSGDAQGDQWVTYKGGAGPGKGMHNPTSRAPRTAVSRDARVGRKFIDESQGTHTPSAAERCT